MKKARIEPSARRDIERIEEFISRNELISVSRFRSDLERGIEEIENNPSIYVYNETKFGTRFQRHRIKLGYIIFYIELSQYISIMHIVHEREEFIVR
ncbi:Plasmid stabilization system protein ParE [Pilibacter termitis]|uniref:Plasmid stabilization system protein ParE n=1 Tax=Pilibacter termitis TaxID=263852 RepID=A0A1T4QYG9_9ENTE|nr:type II toxin-antitoxin system RelE/ParE family toxin [Pilibacter termitis]SKA08849.1 Plasmid stabilization system protein ParE [Pilibacter termitis]